MIEKTNVIEKSDKKVSTGAGAAEAGNRYKAPALEKGLDILELLAAVPKPLTASQIATRLNRSVSELFRMLMVLEQKGYIAQADEGGEGYTLTNKLFTLGLARTPTRTLLEAALPVMSELVREIGQSCHLVVASGDQVVVVARVESPCDLGFSVRVGYRRPLLQATSGQTLLGFQPPEGQRAILAELKEEDPAALQAFIRRAEAAVEKGYVRTASDFVEGVTDISVPILGAHGAVAALTVPFVNFSPLVCSIEEAIDNLKTAAKKISTALSGQNHVE